MKINKEQVINALDFTEKEYCKKAQGHNGYSSFDEFIKGILSSCEECNGSLEDAVFIANDAYEKL